MQKTLVNGDLSVRAVQAVSRRSKVFPQTMSIKLYLGVIK